MADQWVVLLEVSKNDISDPIDAEDLRRLYEALGGVPHGGVLTSSDRYALQVTTTANGPVDALWEVVAHWADSVRALGLPAWDLVRTEAFTQGDLEREIECAQRRELTAHPPVADPGLEEHHAAGTELLHRAFSDSLTGLLGHDAFAHRLDAALMAAAARGRRPVAVVCVDVDDFQRLNDVFEAATGDEVLIVLADRLVPMLRPGDVLARLGGDEYGILLEDSTEAGARTVAERMLGAIRLPMRIGGREIEVSASAGLALSQPGDDAEILLRNAESALTVAKQRGGDRLALCHPTAEPAPTEPRGADAPHDRFVHLRMAQEAAVAANASDRLEEAAGVVMRQLCSHVGCAMAHLWVSTGDTPPTLSSSVWHIADANDQGRFQDASRQLSFASGIGLPGRVLASGVPAWIPDLASDPNWLRGHEGLEAGLESGGAFPLLIGREVAAVVELFFRSRTEASRLFLDVLAGIGIQLGRVLERQRAFETLHRATEELRASQDTCGTPTTRPS